ncbi:PAS domain-containing protein [Yoonia litorea]|uniref:PAS domain-containing protein n=1 Tax=Yoonia litorea TaxID=1123755 RepID=A0A1I6M3J8_9RHOB|nr:PAS domain-containing protein [Yoonia litorea]SFS10234.1 PAS domain-containing protein [Yoonia litorea]
MQSNDETTQKPAPEAIPLDHPHLVALERYWQSLRKTETVPQRIAMNPSAIESVLPHAFILQRVAAGTARFRVAGQRIHDLLKMDPRGMPFSTLFQQQTHDDLRELTEAAFADPAIVGLPLVSDGGVLRPGLSGALLLLPMRDTAGETTRLLGAFVTGDHASRRPRRFRIALDQATRVDPLGPKRPVMTLLNTPPDRIEKGPDTPSRPALKLVVNNG